MPTRLGGRAERGERDKRGADVIAFGLGGKALNMNAENIGKHLRLGIAQGWKFGRDVAYRTVPLAQLHTRQRCSLTDRARRGGETFPTQTGREDLGTLGDRKSRVSRFGQRHRELIGSLTRKSEHCVVASVLT